jgi:spermidine/putrescine-binding protein
MTLSRRQFNIGAGALLSASGMMGASAAYASRNDQLNILCWEGSARYIQMRPCAPKAARPTPI